MVNFPQGANLKRKKSIERLERHGAKLSSRMDAVVCRIGNDAFTYRQFIEMDFRCFRAVKRLGIVATVVGAKSVADFAKKLDVFALRDMKGVGQDTLTAWYCALELTGRSVERWLNSDLMLSTIVGQKQRRSELKDRKPRRRRGETHAPFIM